MGGVGLLTLVSIGKENIYLSAQPEITYFKIAYKRYTNFSIEPVPQYFKTTPDFGRRCTVSISKNADLIGMTHLYAELPTIQLENISDIPSSIKKFSWVNKPGLALINYIEVEIGGEIVDRHYADWINIWHELTIKMGLRRGYNKMIGNITELTSFTNSKNSTIVYIPLCFWFCLDTGLALPIIALHHNDIKIHVQFNDVSSCYNISPSKYIQVNNNFCLLNDGELFYQNFENNKIIGKFVYFDVINQRIYYNSIKGKFNVPITNNDVKYRLYGNVTKFEINISPSSIVVSTNDYFSFNQPSIITSYLIINYIYLDNFERINIINKNHDYLVPIVQRLSPQVVYSTNVAYKLPLVNPNKLIVWTASLLSNINNNNTFNYTTFPYTDTEENLITSNLVVINSINNTDINSFEYYTFLQKYQSEFQNAQKGINIYSYANCPKDLQPSGSLNFSKIDNAYLQLTMNKIVNYQNPAVINGYGLQYNVFRISSGIGGLVFKI